jgi:endonuclease YncB( thermonuclease family)
LRLLIRNALSTLLVCLTARPADQPPTAASPLPAAGAPTGTSTETKIDKPINEMVRVVQDVTALDRPKDGKRIGHLRADGRIKARGVVVGGEWVQVELPNATLAYVPIAALALDAKPGAAASATPASAPPVPTEIKGSVTSVPNAATLVINDHKIALDGIAAGPADALGSFDTWVRGQGDLNCEPQAQTGKYRCFTKDGIDAGEAAILNGVGRVGDGATTSYRDSENKAREAKRGLWAQP